MTETTNFTQIRQELRRGYKLYEAFKEAEKVIFGLENLESESNRLTRDINSKKKELDALGEKAVHAYKVHESNLGKQKIDLDRARADSKRIKDEADDYRNHEKAKAVELIRNAQAHVESMQSEVESLKNEIKDLKVKKAQEEKTYNEVMEKVKSLRKMLD